MSAPTENKHSFSPSQLPIDLTERLRNDISIKSREHTQKQQTKKKTKKKTTKT